MDVWESLIKKKDFILKINHPNIVKIENIKTINGYNCIIETYIPGRNLNKLIEDGVVTLKEWIVIFSNILKALAYVHKNGLCHKNINPFNIIYNNVEKKATLVNIDYIAIENEESKNFFGTIKYSAPEQILENATSIQADLYSLGLVSSYLIIGHIPFCMDLEKRNQVL